MPQSDKLYLYDTASRRQADEARQDGLDVHFPAGVGWTDVLDCRTPPYDARSIDVNCEYASHVRKVYILVTEDHVVQSTPPTAD